MQWETTNKLLGIRRHQFYLVPSGIVTPAKRNFSILQGQNPVIGNSHTVSVLPQIGGHFSRAVKGSLAQCGRYPGYAKGERTSIPGFRTGHALFGLADKRGEERGHYPGAGENRTVGAASGFQI